MLGSHNEEGVPIQSGGMLAMHLREGVKLKIACNMSERVERCENDAIIFHYHKGKTTGRSRRKSLVIVANSVMFHIMQCECTACWVGWCMFTVSRICMLAHLTQGYDMNGGFWYGLAYEDKGW